MSARGQAPLHGHGSTQTGGLVAHMFIAASGRYDLFHIVAKQAFEIALEHSKRCCAPPGMAKKQSIVRQAGRVEVSAWGIKAVKALVRRGLERWLRDLWQGVNTVVQSAHRDLRARDVRRGRSDVDKALWLLGYVPVDRLRMPLLKPSLGTLQTGMVEFLMNKT